MSSNGTDEEHLTHSQSDTIEIRIYDKTDKVIKELLELLLSIYRNGLEKTMRGCGFSFDYVDFSNHKCHKVIPKYVGSYVGSPVLVK